MEDVKSSKSEQKTEDKPAERNIYTGSFPSHHSLQALP